MPLQVNVPVTRRLAIIAGFLAAGCGSEPAEPVACDVPTVAVTGLPDSLPALQPVQLAASIQPAICASEAVTWSASEELTITAGGQVTATQLGGPFSVTATVKGVAATQATNVTMAPLAADAGWALAWVDTFNLDLSPSFSFSTGGAVRSSRRAPGLYLVRFPGLATGPGQREVVHVSAYGSEPRRCRVFNWNNAGADLLVEMGCSDLAGNAADAKFTILVVPAGRTQGRSGFVVTPAGAGDPVTAATAHNSSQGGVSAVRDGLGSYTVTFAGLARESFATPERETFHVTTVGSGTNWCKINFWSPSLANPVDVSVRVDCYDVASAPADARFSVLMLHGGRTDRRLGYVYADSPSEDSYTPTTLYQFNSAGATNTAVRLSPGLYDVVWTGLERSAGSTAETNLVTAYGGSGPTHCQVGFWDEDFTRVRCFAPDGTATDARFVAIWIE